MDTICSAVHLRKKDVKLQTVGVSDDALDKESLGVNFPLLMSDTSWSNCLCTRSSARPALLIYHDQLPTLMAIIYSFRCSKDHGAERPSSMLQ